MKRAKENKPTATTKTAKRSPVGTAIKTFVLLLLAGDLLSLLLNLVGKVASGLLPTLSNAVIIVAIGALTGLAVMRIVKQKESNDSTGEKKKLSFGAIFKGVLAFVCSCALIVLGVKLGGKVLTIVCKLTLTALPVIVLFAAGYMAVSRFFKCREDANPANYCPSLTMGEWRARESQKRALSQARQTSTEQVSQEVAMYRAKMAPDINACLSTVSATWSWASATSAARIYVRYDENPNGFFQGNLTVFDGRVTEVAVPLSANQTQRYPNAPLLAAQKAEKKAAKAAAAAKAKAEQDAFSDALAEFFGTRKDGARAHFANLNPARKSFTLTAPLGKFSVKEAKATAETKAGHIVAISVMLSDGNTRIIKRGKQGTPAPAQPKSKAAKPTSEPDKGTSKPEPAPPAPVSGESALAAPAPMENKPAPAAPAPTVGASEPDGAEEAPFQHAEPVDIHQPSGLDKDALERHVRLYADDAGKTINDVAVTAYNAGQEYCLVDWPEGLLTLEEVEAFARILTADYNFSAYEILESTHQVKLRLGMVNSGADNSLEELVAEMIPGLEASAAQQLFEDGEEWTTINWPPEVDSIKAANEFARFLISKSNFDDFRVAPTGQLRLHMAGEDEL